MDPTPGSDAPSPEGPRDPALIALSLEQAAAFRRHVRGTLAERGIEVAIEGNAMRTADGRTLGLHNLSAVLAQVPYAEWPEVMESHLTAQLAATAPDSRQTQDPDQVLVRLRYRDMQAPPLSYPAPAIGPELLAVLAFDLPTHVEEVLVTSDLGDVDDLYARGRANLAGLPAPEVGRYGDDDEPTSTWYALTTEDYFGASRLLVLAETLQRVGIDVPPAGLLVAAPNRHLLLVHPITGVGVLTAASTMGQLARLHCEPRPGPLSELVLHVGPELLDGPVTQVTRFDEDGTLTIEASGPFAETLRQLGLLE